MNDLLHTGRITLPEFIRKEESEFAEATGELTHVLLSIALGTKIVSRGVNMAGLAALLGLTGETNVQGETVQKLDEYADEVFSAILGRSREVISMVSEEHDSLFAAEDGGSHSKYVIAFDPLDGSSNIDVNVAIGTIWGVYERLSRGKEVDPRDMSDFLQAGRKQIAAGYVIYGSSTMFVYTTGKGVNGFTLDPTIGEFILTNSHMSIPKDGSIYSCNEANASEWPAGARKFIGAMQDKVRAEGKRPSARYVGSLVADFHRTMLKGGIYMYPGDAKNTNGKLRLLYECAPLAFIAEQAGGAASDGRTNILDLVPNSIHERSPLFIGSENLVKLACEQMSGPE